jgi:hypothetical protein
MLDPNLATPLLVELCVKKVWTLDSAARDGSIKPQLV